MTTRPSYLDLAIVAAQAADDKKAIDPVILDVGDMLSITDAFVIASAPNRRQVAMIADEVELAVKVAGGLGPVSVEGLSEASWVLLDFAGFVVHVFLDETRKFYDLERLWNEAPRIDWASVPSLLNPIRTPSVVESETAPESNPD
jgi:ribosome-associated protein